MKKIIMSLALVFLLAGLVSSSCEGTFWTTDETGSDVQKTSYATGEFVYIYGNGFPSTHIYHSYEIMRGASPSGPVVESGTVETTPGGDITPDPTKIWEIPTDYPYTGPHKVYLYTDGCTKHKVFQISVGETPSVPESALMVGLISLLVPSMIYLFRKKI